MKLDLGNRRGHAREALLCWSGGLCSGSHQRCDGLIIPQAGRESAPATQNRNWGWPHVSDKEVGLDGGPHPGIRVGREACGQAP